MNRPIAYLETLRVIKSFHNSDTAREFRDTFVAETHIVFDTETPLIPLVAGIAH